MDPSPSRRHVSRTRRSLAAMPICECGTSWNRSSRMLGISSATADQAGVFHLAAGAAARRAGSSQWRLLIGLYVVGVMVTAVLSNDTPALLLTPIVFAIAARAGVEPRPYAFACAVVAHAASFILPVSNPSNLLQLARAAQLYSLPRPPPTALSARLDRDTVRAASRVPKRAGSAIRGTVSCDRDWASREGRRRISRPLHDWRSIRLATWSGCPRRVHRARRPRRRRW